jgi:hypothetical protein
MRQELPNNTFFEVIFPNKPIPKLYQKLGYFLKSSLEVIFPNKPIPKLYQKLDHFLKSSLRLKRDIGQFLPYNAAFDLATKESPISSLLV